MINKFHFWILIALLFPAFFSQAVVHRKITGTWNMQGGTSGGTDSSKWTASVANIMNRGGFADRSGAAHHIDVLALQEAGEPPRSEHAAVLQHVTRPGPNPANNQVRRNTETIRNHYVYYTEVGGNARRSSRVNSAIVTREEADEVILFPVLRLLANSNISPTARPTLGIRIGDDFFFTVHAGSMGDGDRGNRNEAPRIVDTIESYMVNNVLPTRPLATWIIMGDFNRSPSNLFQNLQTVPANLNREIVYLRDSRNRNCCALTHISTRSLALDYAVVGSGPNGPEFLPPPWGSFLIASSLNHLSDHIAIRFRPAGM